MNWWGEFNLQEDKTALWELGPLCLAIRRLTREWRLSYEHIDVLDSEEDQWSHRMVEEGEAPEHLEVERYVFQSAGNILNLLPALADRPVVSRPFAPFTVPSREEVAVFVSTPLWVHIQVGDQRQTLRHIPIRRPSDTWFGPSTREGELCYASRTHCRLNLSEIPLFPYRAVTRVLLRNRANSALLVERLNLPVPFFSIFAALDGRLWTEAVTMVRARDSGQADLRIQKAPPEEAAEAIRVTSPQEESGELLSIRAFGAIFRDAARWS